MPSRIARTALVAAAALAGFAAPAAAQAPSAGSTGGTEAAPSQEGLIVGPGALLSRKLPIRGTVDASDAGRTVKLERLDEITGQWFPITETVVAEDGTFVASWKTDIAGRHTVRATIQRATASARAAAEPLIARVSVFKAETATWYGPGFFGKRMACGTKLTRKTLGVAHRKLPCGTRVELYHRGRTITVPVVDRGPFARGRKWDLTAATARALGVTATTRVGALPAA